MMRALAKTSEYALYLLLLLQPILGLLQTNARGDRVNLFFVGQLPALIEANRPLAHQLLAAHKVVGVTLLTLIGLHALAALFHHFVRRDNVLTRMLPAAAEMCRPQIVDRAHIKGLSARDDQPHWVSCRRQTC